MTTSKKTTPGVGALDVKLEVQQRLERSAAAEAAFRELERDAPTGEGPIVRRLKSLLGRDTGREAAESDRKEHVARAPLHTNPLPEAIPDRKVVRKIRSEQEHITLPTIQKKEVAAAMGLPRGGRALGGTMRIAVPPPPPLPTPSLEPAARAALDEAPDLAIDDAMDELSVHRRSLQRRQHRTRLVLLLALAVLAVVALVLWLVARVREQERESLARESAEARSVDNTATATATASAVTISTAMPISAPAPIESLEPSAKQTATGPATATASARTSVARSARQTPTASSKPSSKVSPSAPATSATTTASDSWIE